MKTCDEMMHSLLERRAQYVAAQKKKNTMLASATATLCVVALVGVAVWQSADAPTPPPVTVRTTAPVQSDPTTTTTAVVSPTTDDTTTTTDSTTTTVGTATNAPSTTTALSKPTTTPSKTQTTASKTPSKSTTTPSRTESTTTITTATTTAPKKTVITGDAPDNDFKNEAALRKKGKYISLSLQQKMKEYEGNDVVFAVYVQIPITQDDLNDDFWGSSEELSQICKECDDVYNAFLTEAKSLNPSWDGYVEIEVWTDTMRANWEYWITLLDKQRQLKKQYLGPYVQSVLNQRFEVLKSVSGTEPIDIECAELPSIQVVEHAYYVELTSEQIEILAEYGGYVFRLAMLGQQDYGFWDFLE